MVPLVKRMLKLHKDLPNARDKTAIERQIAATRLMGTTIGFRGPSVPRPQREPCPGGSRREAEPQG
jgi:hypothetical protein